MNILKQATVSVIIFLFTLTSYAQSLETGNVKEHISDSTFTQTEFNYTPVEKNKIPLKSFIIPAALVTYGAVTMGSHNINSINGKIQDEIWTESPHKLKHFDSYLMFAPAVSVYALNAFGVKGRNNFRDRTMIYLMLNVFANAIIYPVKTFTKQPRPDESNSNSFPSGHTATAFASAEFLRMEYKDVSPWYGVAGYAMATATGYLRMYNNKHWFSDVVAGAGIGIASTKLAYWLYPKIQHGLFKGKKSNTMIMPAYNNKSFGFSLLHKFK